MNIKNFKIIAKLTISAAAFILPLGIMLFSIISISVDSIEKDKRELKGLSVIRPALALLHIIPQYVQSSFETNTSLERSFNLKENATNLLNELIDNYYDYFGEEIIFISPQSLLENWNHVLNTRIRETVAWSYRALIQDLYKLVVYTGDISGLITDSEIESAYLIAATIQELPQAQERMVIMWNLLRMIEDGAFTQMRRAELLRNLDLLVYSDNLRIQNRFTTTQGLKINHNNNAETFETLLKGIVDKIVNFSNFVENALSEQSISEQALPAIYDAANQANEAIYLLQIASLNRLEEVILLRMRFYSIRLTISLVAVALSTFIAFFLILNTTHNIRKSTLTMSDVFKRLDENDLSVKIENASNDELGEFMKALDAFLEKLNIAFGAFTKSASMVTTAVMEMSSSSMELTATANEQSASIAEIVSTMENNKNLSAQASEKTKEVANMAGRTQELSRYGAELRDANEDMMFDIRSQNAKIIEIIKNLADMLSRIDESIQLIDSIADNTKLIAFNAALEASSSGEAGLRFSVVASEIRRFADNVVESVVEIKEKIAELQEASHSLINEANDGTLAIDTGYQRMVEQKEVFENIVEVSKNVAINSQQISSLSKQQELASAQVFLTLKEISSGVNQFVTATNVTSDTIRKLNSMSVELKQTLSKYHTNIDSGNK
ncbi:MAG: methyl-accepting chemotaxis protein [Treponema sp.]|nr:methyl-accepting chemotaxis protein [Treponema sp.]MCL2252066.1 methyl-accepting chemotaxis protein [Treponema sp.]